MRMSLDIHKAIYQVWTDQFRFVINIIEILEQSF